MKKYLIGSLALFAIIYATIIERNLLIKKKFSVKKKNTALTESIKIVHFTDVHLGKYFSIKQLDKLANKINSENPDIVILTGDLVDKMKYYFDDGKADLILAKISAKIGKFAVYGNHDSTPSDRYTYPKILKNAGFTLLKNENKKIKVNDKHINIMGIDDFFQGKIDISKATSNINKDDFNLLLLHEPDLIDKFTTYPIDLALAGHSHGGQIFIPFYGVLVNTGLAERYDRGFYTIGENKNILLYVNTGIGSTGLPVRFGCIPNIAILEVNF